MNVKTVGAFSLIGFLAIPHCVWTTEYVPVKRPEIHIGQTRKIPQPPARQPAAIQSRQVKIPKFESESPAVSPQPPEQMKGGSGESGSSGIKLFNTVEFKRPLATLPGWLDVLERNQRNPVFQPAKTLLSPTKWGELKARTQDLSPLEKIKYINKFWNKARYREDIDNWGREDYWAIPAEFIMKSGDCEDYAIAKYFTLKELGIPPQSMRIVVLRDTIRNLAHAVLAVYMDGEAYILDNLTDIVLSHKRLKNYRPQFSVNEFGRWTHIQGKSSR